MHPATPSNTVMQYKEKQRLTVPAKAQCLSFSSDGAKIACGAGNLIRVWQTSDGARLYSFIAVANVTSIQWGDKQTLYCGLESGDLLVKVFDEKAVSTMGLQASTKQIAYIALDGSGTQMALGGDDEVSIWNLDNDPEFCPSTIPQWIFSKKLPSPPVQQARALRITSLAWSPGDASTLVVSYLHHGVVAWNVKTAKQLSGITLGLVSYGTLSPDGRYFLVSTKNHSFELYTVGTSMHVRTFTDEDLLPVAPRTSPAIFVHNGQWLLGGGMGKATLWHVDSGRQFQSLVVTGLESPVEILAASESKPEMTGGPLSCQVATVVGSQLIVIWHARPLLGRNASEAESLLVINTPDITMITPPQDVESRAHGTSTPISYFEWMVVLCMLIVGFNLSQYGSSSTKASVTQL